jgi:hypothetical protein
VFIYGRDGRRTKYLECQEHRLIKTKEFCVWITCINATQFVSTSKTVFVKKHNNKEGEMEANVIIKSTALLEKLTVPQPV